MYEYFLEKIYMQWFDAPKRPAPPLYKRPVGSRLSPTMESPIGAIAPHSEIVLLTDEQVKKWQSA